MKRLLSRAGRAIRPMFVFTGRLRRLRLAIIIAVGILIFYASTVGLVEAISGNIQVGRLSWLRSDLVLDAIDAYILPARSVARVPGLGWPFQVSESFWKTVTGAPICINYGMHFEQVTISNAPKELIDTFKQKFQNAEIVNVSRALGGRKGTDFIFWEIRFKQDGKLREALMNTTQTVDMTYDVQEPSKSN
jgi:hypothetical protein